MPELPLINRQKACRYGQMLYNIHDRYIGASLDLYGEYAESEVELFRQIVKPGHCVVDIGANMGAHTLFFARQVGPDGAVLAFEPQRIIFQLLCANMALNSVRNCRCQQQAVGDAPGTLLVPYVNYDQMNNFGGMRLGGYEAGEEVPVVTLDSFELPMCHFIKVDVEGMELQALQGAAKTIERHRPFMYVENDDSEKSPPLVRFIDALGYNMYWHKPFYFHPDNFLGNPNNMFPNVIAMNMLCVPKSLSQDLSNFERVEVPAQDPPAVN